MAKKLTVLTPSFSIYLPKNINLDLLIRDCPLEASGGNEQNRKDKAALLLYQLVKPYMYQEDYNESLYKSLHSTILQNIVHDYIDYMNWFQECGIMESDDVWNKGEKSLGYRFTQNYRCGNYNELRTYYIKTLTLIKHFTNVRSEGKKSDHPYSHLEEQLGIDLRKLDVDKKAALEWIETTYQGEPQKKDIQTKNVEKIARGEIEGHFDYTSNRYHSNITNIKRELRGYLTIEGQKLKNIDIKSSQPFFSLLLMNRKNWKKLRIEENIKELNKEDNKKIIEVCINMLVEKGDFLLSPYANAILNQDIYFDFGDSMGFFDNCTNDIEYNAVRDAMKESILQILYSPSNFTSEKRDKFEELYPIDIKLFDVINMGYKKTKKRGRKNGDQRSTLAILLQRIESQVLFEYILPNIKEFYPELPFVTIHDSVLVAEDHSEEIHSLMEDTMMAEFGVKPRITIKELGAGNNEIATLSREEVKQLMKRSNEHVKPAKRGYMDRVRKKKNKGV